jgi:signal transduction histidine kinase
MPSTASPPSPSLLPVIFEAFTQAADARSTRGAGMGIGLMVAKEIVALHRGSIEARSEGPGKGSEFTLRIPLVQAAEAAH